MKLLIVAIGQRLPSWAEAAYADFAKRFPPDLPLGLKALKAEPRGGKSAEQLCQAEATRIEAAIPRGSRLVVLDERGTPRSTVLLAQRLQAWQLDGRDVTFIIGGPDGLAQSLLNSADETLRLTDLTLPHALARVVLVEALYRAWTVTVNHPYHRE